MKHIVILGGGFAGIAAALKIKKELEDLNATLTVIDQNTFHLFTPSLYEVATSGEPKKNIAIPFREIFTNGVTLIKSRVTRIDTQEQVIKLRGKEDLHYDYLVIALGSKTAFYNIPNLEKYCLPFKTIQDALEIKKKIKEAFLKNRNDKKTRIIIGGGGFAGTELAGEILVYRKRLAKKHKIDPSNLEITIIQGSNALLKELDRRVSLIAKKRLSFPGVNFAFGGRVKEVDKDKVFTDDGKEHEYDVLIWTGGVEATQIDSDKSFPIDNRKQIIVNKYLQVDGFYNVFAIGDIAAYTDPKTGKTIPCVAQVAEEQGHTVGENIVNLIKGRELSEYKYRHFGYVVPLRGKYSVAELIYNIHLSGFLGWCLQQVVLFRYLLGILPINKAFVRWNKFEQELIESEIEERF